MLSSTCLVPQRSFLEGAGGRGMTAFGTALTFAAFGSALARLVSGRAQINPKVIVTRASETRNLLFILVLRWASTCKGHCRWSRQLEPCLSDGGVDCRRAHSMLSSIVRDEGDGQLMVCASAFVAPNPSSTLKTSSAYLTLPKGADT